MSTVPLIVELDARTEDLDRRLASVNARLDETDRNTRGADSSLSRMSRTGKSVAGVVAKLSAAALGFATALSAVIVNSAASNRELTNMAATAGTSRENFSALSFAMKQYGLDAKGTADAMNDVSERVAEFSIAGSGAMQDFFDAMGISKDAARAYATEIKDMTGEDITQKLVNDMQDAGVATSEMNFVLKSLTNDLSYSAGAFMDNGRALKSLKGDYNEATKALKLTRGEAADLQKTATDFDLAVSTMGKSGTLISANLAPLLDTFFNSVIATVPTATQVIVDFINSFKTPDEIKNIVSIQNQITDEEKKLATAIENKNRAESKSLLYTGSLTGMKKIQDLTWEIEGQVAIIQELKDREAELTKQRVEDAERLAEGKITATGGGGGTGDELQAILDRLKSEEVLLGEKYAKELKMLQDKNEITLELTNEYYANLKGIKDKAAEEDRDREQELSDFFKGSSKGDADSIDDDNDQKSKSNSNYYNAAKTLANTAFEDNKAVKAGLVIVDTAAGISKAFAELPYPAALAASASIAATGIAQLAAISSASYGGGGSASSATGVAVSEEPEPTSELSVSNTEQGGADRSFIVRFESGDNDELATALNGIMSQAKVNGAIE